VACAETENPIAKEKPFARIAGTGLCRFWQLQDWMRVPENRALLGSFALGVTFSGIKKVNPIAGVILEFCATVDIPKPTKPRA
jgi:hypothetical protein